MTESMKRVEEIRKDLSDWIETEGYHINQEFADQAFLLSVIDRLKEEKVDRDKADEVLEKEIEDKVNEMAQESNDLIIKVEELEADRAGDTETITNLESSVNSKLDEIVLLTAENKELEKELAVEIEVSNERDDLYKDAVKDNSKIVQENGIILVRLKEAEEGLTKLVDEMERAIKHNLFNGIQAVKVFREFIASIRDKG